MREKILVLIIALAICFAWVGIGVQVGRRAESSFQSERIEFLTTRMAELIEQVDVIGSRVTLLERPREPVMLPRHPGRIGSIDAP